MDIWNTLKDLFDNPMFRGGFWTVIAVVAVASLYIRMAAKLITPLAAPESSKANKRLLRLSLAFLLLIIVVSIWVTVLTESQGGTARGRAIFEKVLWTSGVAMVLFILTTSLRDRLTKGITGIEAKHKVRLATNWIGITLFIVATVLIWASGIKDFGIFLGIIGAGLALSLQETLVCIAGWLVLIVKRPFDIGDRIEVDKRIGDVIGISMFQTTMLEVGNWVNGDQSTGRLLIVPNSVLIRNSIYNYGKGFPFIWDEISTVVTFESDWELAEQLMIEKAEIEAEKIEGLVKNQIMRMQRQYAIHFEHLTPIVYTKIAPSGVELTLRHLCPVRQRRGVRHRISRNILKEFLANPNIDFAYPTTRIYRNVDEGKPTLGGADEVK